MRCIVEGANNEVPTPNTTTKNIDKKAIYQRLGIRQKRSMIDGLLLGCTGCFG